jgi:hypothetical protein
MAELLLVPGLRGISTDRRPIAVITRAAPGEPARWTIRARPDEATIPSIARSLAVVLVDQQFPLLLEVPVDPAVRGVVFSDLSIGGGGGAPAHPVIAYELERIGKILETEHRQYVTDVLITLVVGAPRRGFEARPHEGASGNPEERQFLIPAPPIVPVRLPRA